MFFLAAALWMQMQTGQQADSSADQATDSSSVTDTLPVDPAIVQQVKVQITTAPKTVTVGEHFTVTVHVRLPADLAPSLAFPDGPDTATTEDSVLSVSPMQRRDSVVGGFVDIVATYVLAAWYPGNIRTTLGSLVVAHTGVRIPDDSIIVKSVLPEDSAAKAAAKPKKPRGLLVEPILLRILRHPQEHKKVVIPFVLILSVILVGLLWWRSRRKQRAMAEASDWVEREFQRVEAMRLLEKGEPEQYAILMSTVVRQYLVRTFATVRESATTRELAAALRSEPLIPADRVLSLFERVDLLKFAHAGIQTAEAQGAGTESRAIVNEVLDRHQAAIIALEAQQGNATGKKAAAGRKRAA